MNTIEAVKPATTKDIVNHWINLNVKVSVQHWAARFIERSYWGQSNVDLIDPKRWNLDDIEYVIRCKLFDIEEGKNNRFGSLTDVFTLGDALGTDTEDGRDNLLDDIQFALHDEHYYYTVICADSNADA
jgi:hypothetical protein